MQEFYELVIRSYHLNFYERHYVVITCISLFLFFFNLIFWGFIAVFISCFLFLKIFKHFLSCIIWKREFFNYQL